MNKVDRKRLKKDEFYEVEEILQDKIENEKIIFLVKWKDWPHSSNSWVTENDMSSSDMIREYNESKEAKRLQLKRKIDEDESTRGSKRIKTDKSLGQVMSGIVDIKASLSRMQNQLDTLTNNMNLKGSTSTMIATTAKPPPPPPMPLLISPKPLTLVENRNQDMVEELKNVLRRVSSPSEVKKMMNKQKGKISKPYELVKDSATFVKLKPIEEFQKLKLNPTEVSTSTHIAKK